MEWYLAPFFEHEDDPVDNPGLTRWIPGTDLGEGLVPHDGIPGACYYARRKGVGDCLACVPDGTPVPGDWLSQTPIQASAHFVVVEPGVPNPVEV